jgi:xanthine dehydrogenase YagR molybdenum-binding subunit
MSAIGQPLSRVDGRLKVTGAARYAADIPLADLLHASIVHTVIANGRIASVDTTAAERAPGVVAVFTYRNMPRMNPTPKPWSHLRPHGQSYLPLQDDKIHYAGQPIALVVAATRDQAEYAGTLVKAEYEAQRPVVFGPDAMKNAFDPPQFLWSVSSAVGNAELGIAACDVKLERTYSTADRHHNQIESHVTAAVWDATGKLTLYTPTQYLFGERELVSIVLGVAPERLTIVSHFVGGGYGGKAYVWPHTLIAALAAKVLNRPVRLQLTRAQMYSMVGHQPATVQTIAIGARRDGKLIGLRHESTSPTSVFDDYIEYAANCSRYLWSATQGIATNHRIIRTNRGTPTPMRPPHEALGHFALESAMDELAYACGVDPVQVRLLNDTDVDPYSSRPFSSRAMRKCLTEGAARFGWENRQPEPRSMRDGKFLIGQGVASAIYTHWRWRAKARVTLSRDGTALVEAGTQEIGTGTYTVMQQVAADTLGLPFEKVSLRIGDTRLPYSHGSIGSATMANAGSSIMLAAKAARDKAIAMAIGGSNPSFPGAEARDVIVSGGKLTLAGRNASVTYSDVLTRNGLSTLVGDRD